MNNIWKRSLSLFLAFVMIFGMFPVSAFATETEHEHSEETQQVTDEAVLAVQAMIDALPGAEELDTSLFETENAYVEKLSELMELLSAINEAAEALSGEQQAALNYTKFVNVWNIIQAYSTSKTPMLIVEGDGTKETPYEITTSGTSIGYGTLYNELTKISALQYTDANGTYSINGYRLGSSTGKKVVVSTADSEGSLPVSDTPVEIFRSKTTISGSFPNYTSTEEWVTTNVFIKIKQVKDVELKTTSSGIQYNFYYAADHANQGLMQKIYDTFIDAEKSNTAVTASNISLGIAIGDELLTAWAPSGFGDEGNGSKEIVYITYNGSYYGPITVTLNESRPFSSVTATAVTISEEEWTTKTLEQLVANNVTITNPENKGVVSYTVDPALADPGDGNTYSGTYTVTIADSDQVVGSTASAALSIKNFADKNNNNADDDGEQHYTVKYVLDTETVLEESVVVGAPTPAKPSVMKDYYQISGWDNIAATVTEDVTYTAKWVPIKDADSDGTADEEDTFSITWAYENGVVIYCEELAYGATPVYNVTQYGEPTQTDANWAGWNEETVAVTANATYTAKFTGDTTYSVILKEGETTLDTLIVNFSDSDLVKYDAENKTITVVETKGTEDTADDVVVDSETYTVVDDRTNSIFVGWYTDAACTQEYTFGTTPGADVTLYAKWIAETNDNNIVDTDESVTVAITGNGTVTIDGTAVSNGESYIYNSTMASHTIVADPTDDDGSDGSADYIKSIVVKKNGVEVENAVVDGKLTLERGAAYEINVEFGTLALKLSDPRSKVEFNASLSADDVKSNIFAAVVNTVTSKPVTVAAKDVTIQYFPYLYINTGRDLNGNTTGYTSKLLTLDAKTEDNGLGDDTGTITHTYYNFGERFLSGGDATEKVRISWTVNGVTVYQDVEITMQDTRTPATLVINQGAYWVPVNFHDSMTVADQKEALDAAVYKALINSETNHTGDYTVKVFNTFTYNEYTTSDWVEFDSGLLPYAAEKVAHGTKMYAQIAWLATAQHPAMSYGADQTVQITFYEARPTTEIVVPANTEAAPLLNISLDEAPADWAAYIEAELDKLDGCSIKTVTTSYEYSKNAAAKETKEDGSLAFDKVVVDASKVALPGEGGEETYAVTVKLTETADYLGATEQTVYVKVENPQYDSKITVEFPLKEGVSAVKVYTDAQCQTEVADLTSVEAGTYYVKATAAEGYSVGVPAVKLGEEDVGVTLAGDGIYSFKVEASNTTDAIKNYTITVDASKRSFMTKWDVNGGLWKETNETVLEIQVPYGDVITAPTENPTRVGYTFEGWTPKVTGTMPAKELTFTAVWEKIEYTITWKANGGKWADGTTADKTTKVKFGEKIEPPAVTKENMNFAGWDPKVPAEMPATENLVFTATWTDQKTVIWEPNGGKWGESSEPLRVPYATGATIVAPENPFRDGYTFDGWYIGETKFEAGTVMMGDTEVTYTAKWTANKYTVTWDANGGKWADDSTTQTTENVEFGTIISAPTTNPTREGYTFTGWAGFVTGTTTMGANDMSFSATWDAEQYTITFDEDGGSYIGDITQGYGSLVNDPGKPTKTGYIFDKWVNTADNSEVSFENLTMPMGGLALKATWLPDVNGNGKDDAGETATIKTSVLTGGGTITLTPAEGTLTEIIEGENGVYTVVFDQTVEASKTITVTATAIGEGNGYKSALKTLSNETVTVADDGEYTVTAEFTVYSIDAVEKPVAYVNPEKIDTTFTEEEVLRAILTEDRYATVSTEGYDIRMYVANASDELDNPLYKLNADLIATLSQYIDENDYVDVWGAMADPALEDLAWVFEGYLGGDVIDTTRTFKVVRTFADDEVTGTYKVTLKDSRFKANVFHKEGVIYTVDALDNNFTAAVMENLTINGTPAKQVVDVTLTPAENASLPGECLQGPVQIIVSVPATEDYLYTQSTITVQVKNKAHGTKLTATVSDNYTVVIKDAAGNEVANSELYTGDYSITVTPQEPTDGYFVNSEYVTIVDDATNSGRITKGTETYGDGYAYTLEFTITNHEKAATAVEIKVEDCQRKVVGLVKDKYQVKLETGMTLEQLKTAILDEILDKTKSVIAPEVDFSKATVTGDIKAENGTYDVTITFLGKTNEYPEVSAHFQVVVSDQLKTISIPTIETIHVNANMNEIIEKVTDAIQKQNSNDLDADDIHVSMPANPAELLQGDTKQYELTVVVDETTTTSKFEGTLTVSAYGVIQDAKVTIGTIENGTAVYDPATQMLTVTPDGGYFVDTLTVNDEETSIDNVKCDDVILANGKGEKLGDAPVYTVSAVCAKPSIKIAHEATLTYYDGLYDKEDAEKYASEMNALIIKTLSENGNQIVYNPATLKAVNTQIYYRAREVGSSEVTVNIKALDLGVLEGIAIEMLGSDVITVDVPVEEMWKSIGDAWTVPEWPGDEKAGAVVKALLAEHGMGLMDMTKDELMDLMAKTLKENPDFAAYYENLGAHVFGDKTVEKETIKLVNEDVVYGTTTSNYAELTLEDNRAKTEIKLNTGVTVTYGQINETALKAALVEGVYAIDPETGAKTRIGGSELVAFTKDVTKLNAGEGVEVAVRYAGTRLEYQGSEITGTITVNKATASVSVDSSRIKYHAGMTYDLPVSTTPAGIETLNFIVGLNLENMGLDGIKIQGIEGEVQLLIPESLQSMLDMAAPIISEKLGREISFEDGATMKLSELQQSLDAVGELIVDYVPEYAEWVNVLMNMMASLPTDVMDIQITLGGKLPTGVGVYLVGAVTTDSNYETAYNVGVIAITPDGKRADIDWVYKDENFIITNTLLENGTVDLSAKVTKVYDGDPQVFEDNLFELFIGVGIDDVDEPNKGKITLTTDQTELDVGAYVEVAMAFQWGNECYYSMPIARPIIVVAESLNVDFKDANDNQAFHFVFNNEAQSSLEGKDNLIVTYKEDGNGYAAGDAVTEYNVKYLYAGMQTNGIPYASTTAPTHAGAYTLTALVYVRNGDKISHAGVGIAALVIEPAGSETTVTNKAVMYEEDKSHGVADMVTVKSDVAGVTPDKTIITAGLSADLDTISSLQDIKGTVNVDMPEWLDKVLNKLDVLEAGYTDTGITVSIFKSYVDKIYTALNDAGITAQVSDDVKDAFDGIMDVVNQLPDTVTLTFKDDMTYSEVGAYLVIGVVTDSDHYPSVGVGLMVIYPNATEVALEFEEDWNGNKIFTWAALKNMNLDASAYDLETGAWHEEATSYVHNLYLGVDVTGKIVLMHEKTVLDNKTELNNGIYSQVAFVLHLSNEPYYAKPISRAFVIVPNPVEIVFKDEQGNVNDDIKVTFDGKAHGVTAEVTSDNPDVELNGTLTVHYTGVQTNGEGYNSTEKPTHSGVYAVTATFTAKDEQDRLVTLGVKVGVLAIEPANAEIDVTSMAKEYGSAVAVADMIKATSPVDGYPVNTTVITAGITTDGTFSENLEKAIVGAVNVDFPEWLDTVLKEHAPKMYEGMLVEEFNAEVIEELNAVIAEADALAEEYEIPADKLINMLENAMAEVEKVVNQLPKGVKLTFDSNISYTDVGAYLVVGIVTDSNHYPAMDAGVLVIYPKVEKAELEWNYVDANGIFTLPALSKIDLAATGWLNNEPNGEVTAMINYLTVGIDEDGKLIVTTQPNKLTSNGAYTEVAYIPFEIGAEMTVAAPIMRSFLVVPQTVEVTVTDTRATVGIDYEVPVSVNKQEVNKDCLTVTYIGANAAVGLYNSTEKPVNAGLYTVVATYVEKDANGEYAYVGMNVGTLTIAAASAEVSVENELHVTDGKAFDVMSLITKKPAAAKIAVIMASLNADGDVSADGVTALGTYVNVDFPARADEIIKQILPEAYADGINLGVYYNAAASIQEKLAEIGIDSAAVDYVTAQLKELPSNTVLTFKEQSEVNPSTIGVYMIGAVVMDPDYVPEAGAGLLVITNDITLADIKWDYDDDNNIITRHVIADMPMGASAYVDGKLNAENTARIEYVILGVGENGSVVLTQNPEEIKNLPNGVYTEIAYIYQKLDDKMTIAVPEKRTFMITEQTVDVIFEDVTTTYDGNKHAVEVAVKDLDGKIIDRTENLTVTYINLGRGYNSTVAPTEVGSYTVIAKYEEYINGALAYIGLEVGNVTITPAEPEYKLTDKTVCPGTENAINGMITNTNELPYAIYVVHNKAAAEMNVILPAGWEVTLNAGDGVDALIAALEKLPAAIENTKVIEAMKSVLEGITLQTLTVNGAQPTEEGEYTITAIAFGNLNYNVVKADGVLTVEHAGDKNADHKCDFDGCQEKLSDCVDNNADHECDFDGCQTKLSDCVDNNADHKCDFDGCQTKLSDCVDNNADHKCDFDGCEEKLSDCVDNNADHKCDFDGCQTKLSDCVDNNADHKCDFDGCQTKLSDCVDNNADHKCDFDGCEEKLSDCVDNNADHKCDFDGCKTKLSDCVDNNADHKCDICGAVLSGCTDANKDGECDICGAEVDHSCSDGNKDHKCDICGERISWPADNDNDHHCDICGRRLTYCIDLNFNHICDICGDELSDCVDNNDNHVCDYCGEELSECADTDKDHECDYCSAELSKCADSNKDHKCDVCGRELSKCEDTNKDHKCDTCGAEVSKCADNDKDHKCDICGAELSKCADNDKDHKCDTCGKELSKCTDADEDDKCDICGKELETDPETIRLVGKARCETARLIADDLKAILGVEKFNAIIYATGDKYPDALTGTYLANLENAPILLYRKAQVQKNLDYIKANLTKDGVVYILGGEGAIPANVEAGLKSAGIKVVRLGGISRYATNLEILKETGIKGGETVLVCTGNDYPDALAASATGMPILLVNNKIRKLNDLQLDYLKKLDAKCNFIVIGGEGAVCPELANELAGYDVDGKVERIGGARRYETCVMIADRFYPDADKAVVAYGRDYPDALCGGTLAYAMNAPVLLFQESRTAFVADYVTKAGIEEGYLLGGVTRVSDEAACKIFKLATADEITVKEQ